MLYETNCSQVTRTEWHALMIGIDYPYYCPICDENMFKFETFRK